MNQIVPGGSGRGWWLILAITAGGVGWGITHPPPVAFLGRLAAGMSRSWRQRFAVLSVVALVLAVAGAGAANEVAPLEKTIFGKQVLAASGTDVEEVLNGCEGLAHDPSARVARNLIEELGSAKVTRNGVKLGLVGDGRVNVVEPFPDGTVTVTVDGVSGSAKGMTRLEFLDRPTSGSACLILTIGRLGQGEGTLSVKPWCRDENAAVDQNLGSGSMPVRLGLRLDQCASGGLTVDVYVASLVGTARALVREARVLAPR